MLLNILIVMGILVLGVALLPVIIPLLMLYLIFPLLSALLDLIWE